MNRMMILVFVYKQDFSFTLHLMRCETVFEQKKTLHLHAFPPPRGSGVLRRF